MIRPYFLATAICSSRFDHDDGRLMIDASEMARGWQPQQIYDDACDVGIAVRSKRTGRVVAFALVATDRDRDGDIVCWRFEPIREHAGVDASVVIFND